MKKTEIFNLLVDHTKSVVSELEFDIPEITPETYFVNIGANSCDRAEIATETLESLSINTPLERILVAGTVGEMVDLIFQGTKH